MRLKWIKLAGFKSFVDSTTVKLPSNLTGVVGPNGCGKSNIIDAVRWVMGEGSAKNLRGESMADVIFNGSTGRKPVNQAAIELCFDNSDHSLVGEYAAYTEIVVRREVTRDGGSNYYLNGTRCRRRDIIDIFLGTGLGPRSYAIIEQGMISRLIEAKPEELRIYLEEAAGISKYKERRRETENRIRHTQDNLDRLNDVREELSRQLKHLHRQAQAAERFKVLREEEKVTKAQYLALQWQDHQQGMVVFEDKIKEYETNIEAERANLRKTEAASVEQRQQLHQANERLNERQSAYYQLTSEVGRLEADIKNRKERCQLLQQELSQADSQQQQLSEQIKLDGQRLQQAEAALTAGKPQLNKLQAQAQRSAAAKQQSQVNMNDWQQEWNDFQQRAASMAKQAEVEQTRIQHFEQQQQRFNEDNERKQHELSNIDIAVVTTQISKTDSELKTLYNDIEQAQHAVAEAKQTIQQQRQHNDDLRRQLDNKRSDGQRFKGQLASLQALQKDALGDDKHSDQWLTQFSLQSQQRLAQTIKVNPGFEKAAEVVLGSQLQALCLDDDQLFTQLAEQQPKVSWTFVSKATSSGSKQRLALSSLAEQVTSDWALGQFLQHVYVADNLSEALAAREQLADDETIITRDGVWLGKHSLRLTGDKDKQAGILLREQQIKQFEQDLVDNSSAISQLDTELEAGKQALQNAETTAEQAQKNLNQLLQQQAELKSQLNIFQNRQQQLQQRQSTLEQEIVHNQQRISEIEQDIAQARVAWQEALHAMEGDNDTHDKLIARRDEIRENLEQQRQQAQQDREAQHQLELKLQSAEAESHSLRNAVNRLQAQQTQLQQQMQQKQHSHQDVLQPIAELEQQLNNNLNNQLQQKQLVVESRQHVEQLEAELATNDQQRQQFEEKMQQVNQKLEQQRLQLQSLKVRQETVNEQLVEHGFLLEDVRKALPPEANKTQWQQQLEVLANRIKRLGPINLAAIEEYKTQEERKVYLDAQYEDLVKALDTLQQAIAKIDRESREKLRETFETVNANFQTLFPKVFGGGSASLVLSGDDLLSAGVALMAQPPGKRNTTIHLLSGGEKALTAMALVFSLFQLNPAPFCMLDEVDAPLDDFNVMRFCSLVREMSKTVQFIFISHNKQTIELADQLTGVTMNEPGVSRLVAVDIEKAVALAEAS